MGANKVKLKKPAKRLTMAEEMKKYEEKMAKQHAETNERELAQLRPLLKQFSAAGGSDEEKTKAAKAIMVIATTTYGHVKNEEYLSIEKVATDHLDAIKTAITNKKEAELEEKKKLIGKKATFKEDYSFMGNNSEGRFINKGVVGEVLDVKRDSGYWDDDRKDTILILVRIEESPVFHLRILIEEDKLTFA